MTNNSSDPEDPIHRTSIRTRRSTGRTATRRRPRLDRRGWSKGRPSCALPRLTIDTMKEYGEDTVWALYARSYWFNYVQYGPLNFSYTKKDALSAIVFFQFTISVRSTFNHFFYFHSRSPVSAARTRAKYAQSTIQVSSRSLLYRTRRDENAGAAHVADAQQRDVESVEAATQFRVQIALKEGYGRCTVSSDRQLIFYDSDYGNRLARITVPWEWTCVDWAVDRRSRPEREVPAAAARKRMTVGLEDTESIDFDDSDSITERFWTASSIGHNCRNQIVEFRSYRFTDARYVTISRLGHVTRFALLA